MRTAATAKRKSLSTALAATPAVETDEKTPKKSRKSLPAPSSSSSGASSAAASDSSSEKIKIIIKNIHEKLNQELTKNKWKPREETSFCLTEMKSSVEDHLLTLVPFLEKYVGTEELETILVNMQKDILDYLLYNKEDFLHHGNIKTFIAINLRKQLKIYATTDYHFNEFIQLCGLNLSAEELDELAWEFLLPEVGKTAQAIEVYLHPKINSLPEIKNAPIQSYLLDVMNKMSNIPLWEIQSVFINMAICVDRCLDAIRIDPKLKFPAGMKFIELCLAMAFQTGEKVVTMKRGNRDKRMLFPLSFISVKEFPELQGRLLGAIKLPVILLSTHPDQKQYRAIFSETAAVIENGAALYSAKNSASSSTAVANKSENTTAAALKK